MSNEYSMYEGKTRAINQLVLILLFSIFYLNWLTIEIHSMLSPILPLVIFTLLFMLVLINIGPIYKDKKKFFLILFLPILTLVGMLFNNSSLGVFFGVVNLSLMLILSSKIKISKIFIRFISLGFLLFFFYWILVTPTGFNTNSLGLVVLTTYICGMYFISSIKWRILRLVIFLLTTIFTFQVVFQSDSRATLIALVIFLLLVVILPYRTWLNKPILRIIFISITLGSIGFVLTYLYLWENNISILLDFSNKKFFSGRQLIWSELWIAFKENILFGVGSNFKLISYDVLNVHNSMFHILTIYGLPIYIIILSQLRGFFYQVMLDKEKSKLLIISVAGFISITIQSFFENTLISANFLPVILFLLITALTTSRIEK